MVTTGSSETDILNHLLEYKRSKKFHIDLDSRAFAYRPVLNQNRRKSSMPDHPPEQQTMYDKLRCKVEAVVEQSRDVRAKFLTLPVCYQYNSEVDFFPTPYISSDMDFESSMSVSRFEIYILFWQTSQS